MLLNDTWAWIIWLLGTAILIGDSFFNYLAKVDSFLVMIAMMIPLLYWLVKSAVKQSLKEHTKRN